jgi:DNA polymerase (family 10)
MPVLTNLRVARVFEQVADLLEAKGESPFKIQAYRRVARNLERLEEDLHLLDAEHRLTDIPGVGKEIEKKIREILRTGKLGYLERLKAELPGVLTLMEIPGIGPKTAYRLTQELGIRTIEDLEAALARGDDFWAQVPRFTPHLVDNIRRGLEAYRRRSPRLPLAQAVVLFEELRNTLAQLGAGRVEPAGSLRRYEETVGDLDLVVSFPDAGELARRLSGKPEVESAETAGRGWVRARLASGLSVDLYVVDPAGFGAAWVWATGNRDHLRELEARLAAVGYRLTGDPGAGRRRGGRLRARRPALHPPGSPGRPRRIRSGCGPSAGPAGYPG